MDTTLRDGEQTSGVAFAAHEKLSIAQALLDLGVNRLEIASARVSDGEFEAVKRVASWAERTGNIRKLEVLGFVDGDVSLNWIEAAGCRVVNLLCKGSYKHVHAEVERIVNKANEGVSRAESIRKFEILPDEFTQANGMLTASLKSRRAQIVDHYRKLIDTVIYVPRKK